MEESSTTSLLSNDTVSLRQSSDGHPTRHEQTNCEETQNGLKQDEEDSVPYTKMLRTTVGPSDQLLDIEQRLCGDLARMQFGLPVTHIYNPLSYAAETHQCYVRSYGNSSKKVLFLGMNPGPFGMAQTGVGKWGTL